MKNRVLAAHGVWLTVAVEAAGAWKRQYRTLLLLLGAAVIVAAFGGMVGNELVSMRALVLVLAFAPLAAGLITMSGIVSDDRESGLILLWFQKPGSLARCYTVRYLIYQLLLAGFALLIAVAAGAAGGAIGVVPAEHAVRFPLITLSLALIPAAAVFAFSAWGVRRDSAVAGLALLAGIVLGGVVAFRHGWIADVARAAAFPVDALQAVTAPNPPRPATWKDPLLLIGHLLAWSALGMLGLRFLERRIRQGG